MALPPRYQNVKDLKVMVDFIYEHPKVAGRLKSIDLQTLTIHCSNNGEIKFGRRRRERRGPGPAAPLEFREANCEIE